MVSGRTVPAIGEADIACQSDGEEGGKVEMAIGFFEQAWSNYRRQDYLFFSASRKQITLTPLIATFDC